jgi:hypothetical protein
VQQNLAAQSPSIVCPLPTTKQDTSDVARQDFPANGSAPLSWERIPAKRSCNADVIEAKQLHNLSHKWQLSQARFFYVQLFLIPFLPKEEALPFQQQ